MPDSPSSRSGGTAVVQQLVHEGIEVVFGLPGVQLMHILDSFHDQAGAVRFVTTRHEQATAYMADGYARVTGRPGVTLIVPGPGVYNAGAALATAYASSSPVLQLSGQINAPAVGLGNSLPHEIHDQLDVVRPITLSAERIVDADDLPRAIHDAVALMGRARPRPAHVEIPPETLGTLTSAALIDPEPFVAIEADPDLVAKAVDLLAGAANPLIVAGGGAHDASSGIRELAEFLQAGVVTTREGKGVIDERHPASLGSLFVHRRLAPAIAAADVILAVGTRFQGFALAPGQQLIHLDVDPTEIGRFVAPNVALVGHAASGVATLVDALHERRDPASDRTAEFRSIRTSVDAQHAAVGPQAALVAALRAGTPEDTVLAVDATMTGYMCHLAYPVYQPRSYLTSSYMGTLGFAFNMSLGAKVAAPDRPVVSVSGDGGFFFASNELATAVQYGLGVVAVVFNDSAYGNTHLDQVDNYGGRILGTELRNPDIPAYAESFGAVGVRVDDVADLAPALRDAIADPRPVVIEVPIDHLPSAF